MKSIPTKYLDRIVDKQHFRVFVYSPTGEKKLIRNHDLFLKEMSSGLWFATVEDAKAAAASQEPEAPKKQKKSKVESELDDFLPKDE